MLAPPPSPSPGTPTPPLPAPGLRAARPGLLLATLLPAFLLLGGPARTVRADDWDAMLEEFQSGQKSEDWRARRDAFSYLSNYDRPEAVKEILSALAREGNGAVLLGGVEALSAQKSLGSRAVLFEAARKGTGEERLLVLLALAAQAGPDVGALLREVAQGNSAPAAAQAALALGSEKRPETVPVLRKLLGHRDWQVRAAAARSLGAQEDPAAVPDLAAALAVAKGRDRADLVAALEKLSGQAFGNDPAAWKKLAQGTPPAEIRARPDLPPSAFGIPIYGERVVIVLDNSLRMGDPHPFDTERLRTLCDVKDGDPIPWFRMQTNAQFAHAHVRHLIQGLPKGSRFELITFNEVVRETFAALAGAGAATRKTAFDVLAALETDNGIATYDALLRALDIAGGREGAAWKSGPDEILFVTVNVPTAGEVKEVDVVGPAIGLRARLRMVPIHTVGIHNHPYEMCRAIAERSGGTYVDLSK